MVIIAAINAHDVMSHYSMPKTESILGEPLNKHYVTIITNGTNIDSTSTAFTSY